MGRWVRRILFALGTIGVLDSIYMTIYKLTDNNAMCLGSGDCGTVNASRYSEVNGIPVALIGVFGYLAILAAVYFTSKGTGFFREYGTLLIFGLSLTGFLFTLWLIYVEVALLKAICPFCLVSQITMTLIFILSIIWLVRQPQFQEE